MQSNTAKQFEGAAPGKRLALGLCMACGLMLGVDRPAHAEIFELTAGGELSGQLLNPEEFPRTHYEIKTPSGIRVKLDRASVRKVVVQRPAEQEYADRRTKAADTIEAQWALAEWCREQSLNKERKTHLDRVLELDPNHLEARRVLGYSQVDGRWMTQAERMESGGFVFYRGQWRLPQQVELLERKDKQDRAEKEWYRKLRMYRGWLDDKRYVQAVDKIRNIDDPYAVRGLSDLMAKEPNWQIRKLYMEALGNIGSMNAMEVMVMRTLVDGSDEVRYTAMDYFPERNNDIVTMYIRALKSQDNDVVNRAAEGLKKQLHPGSVGQLIEALVTDHKFQLITGNPGGGMSMSFGGQTNGPNAGAGGGMGNLNGFSAGSSSKIIVQQVKNRQALEALVAITGQNFQYNVDHWKLWYSQQKTPASLGIRRD